MTSEPGWSFVIVIVGGLFTLLEEHPNWNRVTAFTVVGIYFLLLERGKQP